jgi:hypothetical protein
MQLSDSETYTSATGALDKFLDLQPLVASIERVLNDYRAAAYAIAFVLLVVGTMREFIHAEPRRFLDALLQAVLLVASISFAPNFIDWCDQGNTRRNTANCKRNCSFFQRFPFISTIVDGFRSQRHQTK